MSEKEVYPGRIAPAGFGLIAPEEVMKQDGISLLRRMVAGEYPAPAIAQRLNFVLAEVGDGRAVFYGLPSERHLNPLGAVHGGWASAILDSALGCAVHTTLAQGEGYGTVEFKVNLIRPITPKTGEVTAIGRVVNRGRTIAVSEARLEDANGKLLATGMETCAIFTLDKQPRG